MVSQIVWLGMKDVFTQIAKDVVGQGLDHEPVRSQLRDDCLLGCDRGERNAEAKVDLATDLEESVPFNVLDATFILEFSSSQMFSMLFRDSLGSTETERNALMLKDFS
uniref:Uncharacterized protein n=1 Tax=Brassica oleracea var. oleracea TaxID=109376 RepID=A0A0D3BUU3_BRAOL